MRASKGRHSPPVCSDTWRCHGRCSVSSRQWHTSLSEINGSLRTAKCSQNAFERNAQPGKRLWGEWNVELLHEMGYAVKLSGKSAKWRQIKQWVLMNVFVTSRFEIGDQNVPLISCDTLWAVKFTWCHVITHLSEVFRKCSCGQCQN